MKRILISGYYGFNNSGDEAILQVMVDNLRARLDDIEITVLSHDPEDTAKRYGVSAVARMSPKAIMQAVCRCDLLISGGGSLMQDATSGRSILYYLSIINLAHLLGKKVFIYSQGIGPIYSQKNRRMTARSLNRADGIVVRDSQSKQLLRAIGVKRDIQVTSDPVVRVKRPKLERGREILAAEGFVRREGHPVIGWAVKERPGDEGMTQQEERCIRWLQEKWDADVILIPFHRREDPPVVEKIRRDLQDQVYTVHANYLSEDMLSLVGNLDVLVGVRLHSLIYAAVMGVPLLGISVDPKIDSFLESIGTKPVASAEAFTLELFQEAFTQLMDNYEPFQRMVQEHMTELKRGLGLNETMICKLLGRKEDSVAGRA